MKPTNGDVERVLLLCEDNAADADLTVELLREAGVTADIHVVRDGEEAIAYLMRQPPYEFAPRPHLVLLDLNLPKKDGRRVLHEVKSDRSLRLIPIVVLTTSKADADVALCYANYANSYLVKPARLDDFVGVVESIKTFWLKTARLPDPSMI